MINHWNKITKVDGRVCSSVFFKMQADAFVRDAVLFS